ncbi:MAG: hypothetical protein M1837_000755 [Sclerophora amabilis]|nr:MAG: hypothetical protein M1837_000755 [Sclerophora amabilis]
MVKLDLASNDHQGYMRLALTLATSSPLLPTNFRVGALLLDPSTNTVLSTGYTLELPGNTHAEQCCLAKLAAAHNLPEERVAEVLPPETVLYTTVEPCAERLSGNLPCVERILRTRRAEGEQGQRLGIKRVYVGVKEPQTFVGENKGRTRLEAEGVEVVLVEGLEEEILKVAKAGHE